MAMVLASGPVCSTCHKKVLSAKGTCSGCGQRRRIDPRDPRQLGLCSDCAGLDPWSVCLGCGLEDRIYDAGRCLSCTLEYRLTELVGDSAILDPLRTALLGTDQPRAALRWISNPLVAEVLTGIADGDLAPTHEVLDDLGDGSWLGHLRQVLVAAKVLPERDEQTARLETWIQKQVIAMAVDEDRRVVEAFANWWVLRRYRWRMSKNGVASHQHARRLVLGAVSFLGWVREHGLTLGTCSQAHVELWLAGPPARRHARDFLRWACRRGLAHDLNIVWQPDATPGRNGDTEWHRSLARRFATDESLPLGDRVAGLLLLCYAQPLARLSRLKTTDVTVDTAHTFIQFGRTSVELSEPVGRLVRELVARRRGRAATGAPDHTPWLFPGGRPSRPLRPDAMGLRLARYGLDARVARTSLLLDLAAELSPVVLADLLGMQQRTAVRWVRSASGDWSGYAAARKTSRL